MRHYKPPRYRVLWANIAGELYAADRATLTTAWREAVSLYKSPVPWQAIKIHDTKLGLLWSLTRASDD
jgi:hypothetical protein